MPTIRIDEEVWREIQKHAQPLVDSPNDVLRRMLGLDGKTSMLHSVASVPKTPKAGEKTKATPDIAFRKPILEYLVKSGGRGNVYDTVEAVGHLMKPQLTPKDCEPLNSGPIRWQSAAKWERQHMVEEGLLKKGSPRGIWEVTEKGRQWLCDHIEAT